MSNKRKNKTMNNQSMNNQSINNQNTVESGCPECDGCLAKKKI